MLWWKKLQISVGSPEARAAAIEKLAKSGDPNVIELLCEALQDRDGQVPIKAAEALGRLRNPRGVPALIIALKDKEGYISAAAGDALAEIGEPAIADLVATLNHPDTVIRDVAIRSLGKIGVAAIAPLVHALRTPQRAMREVIIEALGYIRDEQSVQPLLGALLDKERTVREKAARALVSVGKPAVPALVEALKHPSPEVQKYANLALEKLGREPMTETYLRPIAHGKWKDLDEVKAPALDALTKSLADPAKDVRMVSVRNLANFGDERAVPGLTQALADAEREVRDTAIHALVKIGPKAVNHLLSVLADSKPELRPPVTTVLGFIGDPAAREPLLDALEDADAAVRSAAAEALAAYKEAGVVLPLIAALRDDDVRVRFNAIGSLWQIGDLRAVDPLLRMLDDPDLPTRKRAVQALGNIGDKRIIDPLLAVFDRELGIRVEVALAVAKVSPTRAVQPLAAIVRDHPSEADEAIEILADVLEVASKEISPADLKMLTELPKSTKESQAARLHGGMVGKGVDGVKVAKRAVDELVRRGLATPEQARVVARGSADSRVSVRRPGKSVPVHILHGMHQIEPETGTVADLSDGGIGLTIRRPYNPGTMLSVKPTSAGDDIPWILVEVRHCRQSGRTYRVGCKFVRSPSYGVLVLFDRTSSG